MPFFFFLSIPVAGSWMEAMMVAGQPRTRLKVRSQNDKGFVGLWYPGTAMGEPSGRAPLGLWGADSPRWGLVRRWPCKASYNLGKASSEPCVCLQVCFPVALLELAGGWRKSSVKCIW